MEKEEIIYTKVSNLQPDCPIVALSPAKNDGENGWYKSVPSVTITSVTQTSEADPVSSMYLIWKEGEMDMTPSYIADNEQIVRIPGDGIYNIKAWSESASGIQCDDAEDHLYQVKVDTILPVITFETTKGTGSSIYVHFEVKDQGSGVDSEKILVLQGSSTIPVKVEKTADGYAGNFDITEVGNYFIQAADIAGNQAKTVSFTPMSMKIRPVTNILNDSVTLGAQVLKGTFEITGATIAYRKSIESAYTDVIDTYISKNNGGDWTVSAVLDELDPGTVYSYRITATSEADEVLEYEGLFKTLSDESGISLSGTAKYASNTEGIINVSLYDGNVCVMATEVDAGEEFTFRNVPDGNYNIVATDGVYSKSMRVLIKDHMVIYPENYIELVLSGKNTAVVLTTDNTPHITADNMDSIFEDDIINYNADDSALVLEGGTVEFKLYATLIPVTSVSASEIAAMYAVTNRNQVVGAYLDLTLYKITMDAGGNVIERKQVTELARGANISVTIPLGELSGKPGLEVIRIHDTGDRFVGASLIDQDNNPGTYTVTTNQFSTYAVLYSVNAPTTETQPATEAMRDGTASPATDGTIYVQEKNEQAESGGNSRKVKDPDGDVETQSKQPEKIKKPSVNRQASVGSLRSSGSVKTGDTAPIIAVVVVILAMTGLLFVLINKKKRTNICH